MGTRMDKYKNDNLEIPKRSEKNKELKTQLSDICNFNGTKIIYSSLTPLS